MVRRVTTTLTNCSHSLISHKDTNLSQFACKARDSPSQVKCRLGRYRTLPIQWPKRLQIHTSEQQQAHKEMLKKARTLSYPSQTLMTFLRPALSPNKTSKGSNSRFHSSIRDLPKGSKGQCLLRIISKEPLRSSLGPTMTPSLESSRSEINSK